MGNKKRFWLNSFRGVSVFRNILIMPNATYEYDLKIVILSCLKDFERFFKVSSLIHSELFLFTKNSIQSILNSTISRS